MSGCPLRLACRNGAIEDAGSSVPRRLPDLHPVSARLAYVALVVGPRSTWWQSVARANVSRPLHTASEPFALRQAWGQPARTQGRWPEGRQRSGRSPPLPGDGNAQGAHSNAAASNTALAGPRAPRWGSRRGVAAASTASAGRRMKGLGPINPTASTEVTESVHQDFAATGPRSPWPSRPPDLPAEGQRIQRNLRKAEIWERLAKIQSQTP